MDTDALSPLDAPLVAIAPSDAFEQLLSVDVHDETHDVKSFTFVSPDARPFRFTAGQYLALDLEIFTISKGL
jgi:hypothetical protein